MIDIFNPRKAPKICIVAGLALGHVSRVLTIAEELKRQSGAQIYFYTPREGGAPAQILTGRFPHYALQSPTTDKLQRAFEFAAMLEDEIQRKQFDLIIRDIHPQNWTHSIDWQGVPTIHVTNVYATSFAGVSEYQEGQIEESREAINHHRAAKNLPTIHSAFDLYEADLTLLADPKSVCDLFAPLPADTFCVGACYWTMPGEWPESLNAVKRPLIVSLGSTGKNDLSPDVIEHLRNISGADATLCVGASPLSDPSHHGVFDHIFSSLPLHEIIHHAAAIITQGGSGSTYQALAAGKPVFTQPNLPNHYVLSDIAERLGVGVNLKKHQADGITSLQFEGMQRSALALNVGADRGPQTAARRIISLYETGR